MSRMSYSRLLVLPSGDLRGTVSNDCLNEFLYPGPGSCSFFSFLSFFALCTW